MAFSMFSNISRLSNKKSSLPKVDTPSLSFTSILPTQNTMMCTDISSDGSSIAFVNTLKQVFISTNYGASFTQVDNLSSISRQICISNGGRYSVAILDNTAYGYVIGLSSSYGYYQITHSFNYEWFDSYNTVNLFCSMSGDGKYICISGVFDGSIWINNNYGDEASWVNIICNNFVDGADSNFAGEVSQNHATIQACSMSSSGQYITINIDADYTVYNSCILYSSDFGVSFSLINTQMATYGRSTYISSTGDFNVFFGVNGDTNVYYSNNNLGTFTSASSEVIGLMSNRTVYNDFISSNESGSLCYFVSGSTIYVSTDYLQTATIYNNSLSLQDSKILSSANTNYMLVWNGNLQLLNNNLLSYTQVSWPTPSIEPPLPITPILVGQNTIMCTDISSDGSSIAFANTLNQVFISTNYGASFTQASNLTTSPNLIFISNGGQYIAAWRTDEWIMYLSNDSGSTWTTRAFTGTAWDFCMSDDGKYICACCNNWEDGIWINNNYGNVANWVNSNTNSSLEFESCSISSTGQYIIINMNNDPQPAYILYSSNFGVSFSQINSVGMSQYGRQSFISGTGDFALFGGTGADAVYYVKNNADISNRTDVSVSPEIKTLMNRSMYKNSMISNNDGSLIYFLCDSDYTSLYYSTDYLASAISTGLLVTTPERVGICSSANAKYMLVWDGNLQLVTNNSII